MMEYLCGNILMSFFVLVNASFEIVQIRGNFPFSLKNSTLCNSHSPTENWLAIRFCNNIRFNEQVKMLYVRPDREHLPVFFGQVTYCYMVYIRVCDD